MKLEEWATQSPFAPQSSKVRPLRVMLWMSLAGDSDTENLIPFKDKDKESFIVAVLRHCTVKLEKMEN